MDNITTAAQREGVLDGEVWRTINGGHDSWEAYELAENNGANYEHGRITVNFASTNLDLDPGPPIVGTDLYSVIAHEALHLLGFYTYTGATGNSWFAVQPDPSNYFSRFDLFLNDGSQDHIIDPQACTNWASNVNPVDVTNPCNVFFEGPWTIAPEPIYSPAGWQQGSSLSHLDNQCGGGNYLMNQSSLPGIRLIPSQVEANMLCDIGYHTTSDYGDPGSGWVDAYGTLDPCGVRLAGVDDIFDDPTARTFYTMVQGSTITMSDFLANDEDETSAGGVPTA